jgi:site-specific recombinase XerD
MPSADLSRRNATPLRCHATGTSASHRSAAVCPLGAPAGVRRRFAPHQLRHAHALELAREGVPLNIIQRQLGHVNLGTTSIYLQGIDPEEIIIAVRTRSAPMMSASAGFKQ